MRYEVVLFDADNTLFDYDKAETFALENTLTSFGVSGDLGTYHERYKVINQDMWEQLEKGLITKDRLKIQRFEKLFSDTSENINCEHFSNVYLENLGKGSQLLPGAKEICEFLHGKCRLVILTNGIKTVQYPRFEHSEIRTYFEHLIVSEEVGYNKPDERIFEHAFKIIGHEDKNSAIIIGDSLTSDILGGLNFGIDTCWYNPKGVVNEYDYEPKYEIRSLEDLKSIL